MSPEAKQMIGVILITMPSIQFGGYFLLKVISGKHPEMELTDFQKSMFRGGHAHAGVLVILALLVQLFIDYSSFSDTINALLRVGFPLSALLVSGGFFAAAGGKHITQPTKGIVFLYIGVVLLAVSFIGLGFGLLF